MKNYNYFVYITTNINKNVLYTGVTNNLSRRIAEHKEDALGLKKGFTGRYNVYYLIYWERYQYVTHAIDREKEVKGWTRAKKETLIRTLNPNWDFLNPND